MVQKMIEHLEYLVRYMCKTKIKFTNDWQGSLEAPVSGEVHHLVNSSVSYWKDNIRPVGSHWTFQVPLKYIILKCTWD